MEPVRISPFDEVLTYLILLAALVLIPTMLTWWLVAQHTNNRMEKAGSPLNGGSWHPLRFGPLAPIISAVAGIWGFLAFHVPQIRQALHPDVSFAFAVMGWSGLLSFMLSMVLWTYSNAPPRSKSVAD
jgi:hypothetical protein